MRLADVDWTAPHSKATDGHELTKRNGELWWGDDCISLGGASRTRGRRSIGVKSCRAAPLPCVLNTRNFVIGCNGKGDGGTRWRAAFADIQVGKRRNMRGHKPWHIGECIRDSTGAGALVIRRRPCVLFRAARQGVASGWRCRRLQWSLIATGRARQGETRGRGNSAKSGDKPRCDIIAKHVRS